MTKAKLNELNDFLNRYRAFTSHAEQAQVEAFQANFTRLRNQFQVVKEQALEEARLTAPAFNIFRILRLAHYEVRTHSAFLAHLFNPRAAHGQQHLFLDSFLTRCHAVHADFPLPKEDITTVRWQIHTELFTKQGNLDIVLRCPELNYLCVIENKIYASEQKDQLKRYANWMATQAENDDYTDRALIYLTPTGAESATHNGTTYYRLSYKEHIAGWLEAVDAQIAAPRVREVVVQYRHLIQQL